MLKSWKDIPMGGIIKKAGNSKQNKTGTWRVSKPVVDQQDCIKCAQCIRACPEQCVILENDKLEIDEDYCKGCGICADICPKDAIKME
ncbi:MAG: 4Fe-4S dicluster domain-containing protein [Candidatus Moranbacteria bacterium]|nr:4Fe-4S dicluster domain-containing protein [Candidatus Moranbacteria bacterium]